MKRYVIVIVTILLLSLMLAGSIYKTSAVGINAIDKPGDYIQSQRR